MCVCVCVREGQLLWWYRFLFVLFSNGKGNTSDLGLAVGHLLVVDAGPEGSLGGALLQLLHRHHDVLVKRRHRLVRLREVQVVRVQPAKQHPSHQESGARSNKLQHVSDQAFDSRYNTPTFHCCTVKKKYGTQRK